MVVRVSVGIDGIHVRLVAARVCVCVLITLSLTTYRVAVGVPSSRPTPFVHPHAAHPHRHLHALDLRFHLDRQTGAVTRVLDRGARSINFVLSSLVFNVVPTALEIALVSAILAHTCGVQYAGAWGGDY